MGTLQIQKVGNVCVESWEGEENKVKENSSSPANATNPPNSFMVADKNCKKGTLGDCKQP